jgi:hypothetical protein
MGTNKLPRILNLEDLQGIRPPCKFKAVQGHTKNNHRNSEGNDSID